MSHTNFQSTGCDYYFCHRPNAAMNRSRSSQGSSQLNVQSNHSIEDLLSFFEARPKCTRRPSSTTQRNRGGALDTRHAGKLTLGVRSCHHIDRFPVDVRQKIKLFEQGECYDSSSLHRRLQVTKSSFGDLDSLTLHNMVLRNSILFEKWKHSGHKAVRDGANAARQHRQKTSLRHASKILCGNIDKLTHDIYQNVSSMHDELSDSHPLLTTSTSSFDSFIHHERRSSTGRVHFSDISTVWEFNDMFATPLSSRLQPHGTFDVQDRNSENTQGSARRGGLQRRHSTGCVFDCSDLSSTTTTRDFWQLYEKDSNSSISSGEPSIMSQGFVRRRTVRFAPHVTVFVFSGQSGMDSDLGLPQSFVRRASSTLDSVHIAPLLRRRSPCRNRSSEARFRPVSSDNVYSNACPPARRRQSADKIQLPQAHFDFTSLDCTHLEESPLMVPRRVPSNSPPRREEGLPRLPQRRPSFSSSHTTDGEKEIGSPDISVDSMSLADYYVGDTASEFEDEDDGEVTSFADDAAEHDETDVFVSDEDDNNDEDNDEDDDSSVSSRSTGQPLNYMTLGKNFQQDDRRARAMLWYHRMAMPTYPAMRRLVQNTPGLDITLDDVDLLPWSGRGPGR